LSSLSPKLLHYPEQCSKLASAGVTVPTITMRVLPILLLLLTAPPAWAISVSEPTSDIRALWVDAFHEGIRSPAEADRLVADAKMAHINVLFVQVRRRGDSLYTKSSDPPLDDPAYDPGFDALDYVLNLAHREGIQVHAWINATPVWSGVKPPRDPRHVFNRHGLRQRGAENWLTMNRKGLARFPAGYFLDPGHPEAAAYLAEVYLNVVRSYPVDGIHFDYIRYPETGEHSRRGASVGYNPVSLQRFRLATGRSDTPDPGDEQWMAWRREQVTQLVRRIYLEAKAVNPRIQVSAATVAWGKPPADESDFLDAAPGQQVFQDWHGWLKEGILDLAVPMNYARESDLTGRKWFDGWIRWERHHKHGKQVAVGIGAYLNSRQANLAQIARVLKTESGGQVDGVSFFSYANPFASRHQSLASVAPRRAEATAPSTSILYLWANAVPARKIFKQQASIPRAERIRPRARGEAAGPVLVADTGSIDGRPTPLQGKRVSLLQGIAPGRSLGNTYFGVSSLNPGKLRALMVGDMPRRTVLTVDENRVPRISL
jgi:uncharacterized lipoprotein YddW (UPF0748 family)